MGDKFYMKFDRQKKEIRGTDDKLVAAKAWISDDNIQIRFKRKSEVIIENVVTTLGPNDERLPGANQLASLPWILKIGIDDNMPNIFYIDGYQSSIICEPLIGICVYSNCTNTHQLMRCSRCKLAEYCSKDCQKNDWKNHKTVCKLNRN